MSVNFPVYILVIVSFLTWLVFVISACKFYKFFAEFEKFKSTNDIELNSMVWHLKKLEGEISEIVVELRRSNKLLYEIRGAGEFPDHIQEYHDSDVCRHDKADLQKTRAQEISDLHLKHLPDDETMKHFAEKIMTETPVTHHRP